MQALKGESGKQKAESGNGASEGADEWEDFPSPNAPDQVGWRPLGHLAATVGTSAVFYFQCQRTLFCFMAVFLSRPAYD
jgi:hypothetical protein